MKNNRFLLFVLLSLMTFSFGNLSAQTKNKPTTKQTSSQPSKQADRLYKDLGYKVSIPHYEKMESLSVDHIARIANSYRLNHETQNAEFWYEKLVEKSQEPIHRLYYAQALQNNEKFDLAKQYYLEYDRMISGEEGSDRRGQLLAAAIERMGDFNHSEAIVVNVKEVNTPKLDFSPSYYNNGIVFVSSRKNDAHESKIKDTWIDDNFMSIFHAPFELDGTVKDPEIFSIDLTTKYHEGPVSFTRNGDKIFFTRNDYLKGKRRQSSKGVMKLQIYSAEKTDEGWSEPVSLPFNTQEHEEAHPSINAAGDVLFFASDRPGGMGGMDIYMSRLINGKWSAAINLGEEINTAGNEVFPYINDDNTLYFASNGLGGIGGLDIFSTKMLGENHWLEVENIGTPFNSPKDDFGYICNTMNTEGYFTSARDDGYGKDDIYHFKRKSSPYRRTSICTYENGTDNRIEGVIIEVKLKETVENEEKTNEDYLLELEETDNQGTFRMKMKKNKEDISGISENKDKKFTYVTRDKGTIKANLLPNRKYVVFAKKKGYTIGTREIMINETGHEEFCIPLEKTSCIELTGLVKNRKYLKVIPEAKVTIVNLCDGKETVIYSNDAGFFDMPCLECGCEYQFVGFKKYFEGDQKSLIVQQADCEAGEDLTMELLLNPNVESTDEEVAIANIKKDPPPVDTFEGQEIKEGAIIELKNIYYDFDQSYIREDASKELMKVVHLMTRYPTMTIEMGSHTDARGTDKYNRKLSQRRAQQAISFLISNGIDSRRLDANGYGETKLRNRCANRVNCTEEDHQYNRRTEIKIVSLGHMADELDVKYINNSPEKIDRADPNRRYRWE